MFVEVHEETLLMLSCPGQTAALPWGSLRACGAPRAEHPARDWSKLGHLKEGRSCTGKKNLQEYGVKQPWGFLGHLNTTDLLVWGFFPAFSNGLKKTPGFCKSNRNK